MNFGDQKRLEDMEYLNDNIIDFRIKHFILEGFPPELASTMHAFSCQFYTRLLQIATPKEAYKLVAKWTKAFDLFKKRLIFVPINLHAHWSLFIIVRPDLIATPVH